MQLFKVADESLAPEWTFSPKSDEALKSTTASISDIERINVETLDDDQLVTECMHIEKSASNNTPYHYNVKWAESQIDHLREYALACNLGIQDFKGIAPEGLIEDINVVTANVETTMTRTAQKAVLDIGDPFHIEEHSNMDHMEKVNWEDVTKSQTLGDIPSMQSSVVPLRGQEKVDINSDINLANNQNSILNPEVIENLANNSELDTGARLKQERLDKEANKDAENKKWEQDKIDEMTHLNIVSKGSVFPTESMFAQNGLKESDTQFGVYSKSDPKNLPEKTEGELISQNNIERKESISRENIESEKEWNNMSKAATRSISDSFSDSLKKHLNK